MTIRYWDGVALVIGAGDIGSCISDYLKTLSPNLHVIAYGRNLNSKNGIYFDLDIEHSFTSFENQVSLF